MQILTMQIEQKRVAYFNKKKGIVAVYLFGSLVGASYGAKSRPDIDIGVVLDEDSPYHDNLEAKFRVSEELERVLSKKSEDIDVVILNDVSPVIAHEVIKTGNILWEKDREKRADFEVKAELKYYDTKPLREFFWENLVKEIRKK